MQDSSIGSIRSPWTPRETSTPAKWKTANGFRSLFPLSEKEGRSATMGGWPRLTFFFPLDGDHQREDSTVPIHPADKNRGCPTRRAPNSSTHLTSGPPAPEECVKSGALRAVGATSGAW